MAGKVKKALQRSPISYFSDLFVAVMVVGWVAVLVIMVGFAAYTNLALSSAEVWPTVAEMVTIPLSAGGAIWMVKNSVQHAIANSRGERAREDFPSVDASDTIDGFEQPMATGGDSDADGETCGEG